MFQPVYAIQVGSLLVTPHGIAFALGAIFAGVLLWRGPGIRLPLRNSLELILALFFVGLFGARLTYLLTYPDQWLAPSDLFAIWNGGLVSFGGIAAVLLVIALFGKRAFVPTERVGLAAKLPVLTLFAWSVGRIGNFLQGESGGVASDTWRWFYGQVPIQLFESLGCLILALYGFHTLRKNEQKKVALLPWHMGAGYLILRFFVDFWRDEAVFAGLRVSQWAAFLLLCILVGAYGYTSQKSLLRTGGSRPNHR